MLSVAVPQEELLNQALKIFETKFHRPAEAAASAPGRVNLIGEHTDYNDGFVLPMALPLITLAVGSYNNTASCNIVSVLEAGEEVSVSFPAPSTSVFLEPGEPTWANYIKGVVAKFPGGVKGFDAVFVSTVPMGGGLSSSAALEVACFTLLEALTGKSCDPTAKALACQKAEHEFAGMPCGIMDQFISTMGKKDHALLIDCKSLESTLIPLTKEEIVILITNSNVKHKLTGSEYPQRRAQCQTAAAVLGKPSLREATLGDLDELRRQHTNEAVIKRAEHVISEIGRTEEAAKCLKHGDFTRVGQLFYESHESLSKLFEVSCPELDELVRIVRNRPGVLGSRMTGGGFGGCTVTLVQKNNVKSVIAGIQENYKGSPQGATFYICRPSDGATIIPLSK